MTMPFPRIVVGSLTALITSMVCAATPPPASPYEAYTWKALSKAKPSLGIKMGSFEVQYEKTTLAMVLDTVGRGEISHQGDAGGSIYWLCYTLQQPKRSERLWIIAHGEMGGSKHAITSVVAKEIASTEGTNDCPSLPEKLQPVSFGKELWLGIEKEQALKILGRPSHQQEPWWVFDYQGNVPGNCPPDGFFLTNWFFFESKNGRLVQIHAGQVTSC